MSTIHISQDVVPVGEFKARTAHWFDRVRKTGQPVVITQNGRPAGVLISPIEFDRIQEKDRFIESIRKGLADAEAGRVMSTSELKARLSERRKK